MAAIRTLCSVVELVPTAYF